MDELMKVLRELAGKLGVSVEELAPHVIAYERLRGISGILGVGLVFIAAVVMSVVLFRASARAKVKAEKTKATGDKETEVVACVVGWAVLVVGTVTVIAGTVSNLPRVVEPTGAVVRRLLGM